jgi:hypothetical protein
MLSRFSISGAAALSLLAFGCGKSGENATTQSSAPPAAAIPANAPLQDAKQVVTELLTAFRKGDNEAAMKLLTKVARQKLAEKGWPVSPAANERVQIEVDDAVCPTPDHMIAHVSTRWIDVDEMGRSQPNKAIWVCRLEEDGWRVAGFAAYVFEGEDPLLLSFEEPEKTKEKQDWLIKEMERRSKQNVVPAASGENHSQAEKPQDAFRR